MMIGDRRVKKARFKQFNKRQDKSIAEDICSMIYFLSQQHLTDEIYLY